MKLLLQEDCWGHKSTAITPFPSTTNRPELIQPMNVTINMHLATRIQMEFWSWPLTWANWQIHPGSAAFGAATNRTSWSKHHAFSYLSKYDKLRSILDPTDPMPRHVLNIDRIGHHFSIHSLERNCHWGYRSLWEVRWHCWTAMFVDCCKSRWWRSHTWILLFVQNLPIQIRRTLCQGNFSTSTELVIVLFTAWREIANEDTGAFGKSNGIVARVCWLLQITLVTFTYKDSFFVQNLQNQQLSKWQSTVETSTLEVSLWLWGLRETRLFQFIPSYECSV